MDRNIFYFWVGEDIPKEYKKNISYVAAINPEFNVRVVSLDECVDILRDLNLDLSYAIRDIRIPAVQSDICRLALLHEHGGWYLDCDTRPRVSMLHLEDARKDLYLYWRIDNGKVTIQNSVLGGRSGHPFFKRSISVIAELLLNRINNYSVFKTSGPVALVGGAGGYLKDPLTNFVEMDYSIFDVTDGSTKGSWTYQENCGILFNEDNPPRFNPNVPLDRIESLDALKYYRKIFDEFPVTRKDNYRKLLNRAGVHYLHKHKIGGEIEALTDEYMDPKNDREYYTRLFEKYKEQGDKVRASKYRNTI